MAWNMLTKRVPGKEYLIKDFMATRMTKKQFEIAQALNADKLGDWDWTPAKECDFTWWDKCFKKLTPTAIRRAEFRCDWNGKVEEW